MRHWGAEGFERQVAEVCSFYLKQRDAFLAAADSHLTGLAEWTRPEGKQPLKHLALVPLALTELAARCTANACATMHTSTHATTLA